MFSTTSMKQALAFTGVALAGTLGTASNASAAGGCGTPNPLAFTVPFSFECTPAWNDQMSGKTASVTVSGTGTVTLLSYKTQPQIFQGDLRVIGSFPQAGFDIDQVTLTGGTKTLTVDVPSCFYQLDVVNGDPDDAVKSIGVTGPSAGVFSESAPVVAAILGGDTKCDLPTPNPEPEPEPKPEPKPDPNDKPNPYVPPVLPPVGGGSVGGASTPPTNQPKAVVRACSAVKATSYRVRAKQRNTITVRVTTTSTTKPKVTLKGAGVNVSKRVTSKKTAVFRVKPKRAGSIRVTASGCTKVAAVKVLSAKRSQRSGTSPTFTG